MNQKGWLKIVQICILSIFFFYFFFKYFYFIYIDKSEIKISPDMHCLTLIGKIKEYPLLICFSFPPKKICFFSKMVPKNWGIFGQEIAKIRELDGNVIIFKYETKLEPFVNFLKFNYLNSIRPSVIVGWSKPKIVILLLLTSSNFKFKFDLLVSNWFFWISSISSISNSKLL